LASFSICAATCWSVSAFAEATRILQREVHRREGVVELDHGDVGLRPGVRLALQSGIVAFELLDPQGQFADPLREHPHVLPQVGQLHLRCLGKGRHHQ
jgi:hypothetical protein